MAPAQSRRRATVDKEGPDLRRWRFLRFFGEPFAGNRKTAIANGRDVFEVCTKRGRLSMLPREIGSTYGGSHRCGRPILVEVRLLRTDSGEEIHFASADFSQRAMSLCTRKIPTAAPHHALARPACASPRGRETQDDPQEELVWHVYHVDPHAGKLDRIPMICTDGEFLQTGVFCPTRARRASEQLQLEPRLIPRALQDRV